MLYSRRRRRAPGGASARTIADVSSLVVSLDFENATGAGTSGFAVADTAPSGAGANNITQTNTSIQPSISAGVATFDGTNDNVRVAAGADLETTGACAYFIKCGNLSADIPASNNDVFAHWNSSGSNPERLSMRFNTSGQIEFFIAITQFALATATVDAGDVDLTSTFVLSILFDPAGSGNAGKFVVRINGTPMTLTFSGTVPSALRADDGDLSLGAFAFSGNFFGGDIHWFRVTNALPDAADLALLEAD